MSEAIWHGFIHQKNDFVLHDKFGMFSVDGNSAVKVVLANYIDLAKVKAKEQGILTARGRFESFQEGDVLSSEDEQRYDDFFGHRDDP
jgi:hypothetical protein